MLEPREADIPALFLVLVVLPLVTYILLGKWNDAAKKKTRISMLAQLAAEEASRVEAVTPAVVMPVSSSPKTGYHLCARCFGPSTTRCSRCKSVRYCSGKCQIIHWRQGHKQECQQVDNSDSNPSTNLSSVTKSVRPNALLNQYPRSPCFSSDIKQPVLDSSCLDLSLHPPIVNAATFASTSSAVGTTQVSMAERKVADDKWVSQKLNRETLKSEDAALHDSFEETNSNGATVPTLVRKKAGHESQIASTDDIPTKQNANNPAMPAHGRTIPSAVCPPYKRTAKNGSAFEPNSMSGISTLSHSGQNRTNAFEVTNVATDNGNFLSKERSMRNKMVELNSSNEKISPKASIGSRTPSHNLESLMSVSSMTEWNELREYPCSGTEKKAYMSKGSKIPQKTASTNIPSQCSNGILTTVDANNVGVKKLPKVPRQDVAGRTSDRLKKITVLFPYEEFVKLYHCEVLDLIPRGLLNCGNSCYANAVLQCLTSTKPLIIYLLQKSHSRTCWVNNWCLMCELEQHVSILREGRGPLSLSKILSHMRNIGTQMGGGDQEDAHEFLRLLVTSMQSICLEGLGGEKKVDTILQETTLIQQIFGGRLRSKVKCLRCHHESERYENIMDLTLEILGWVESLEDALTQFTSPEDLDGDNMYRCGRCATYVKARKQLSIHEAPNVLTIVLKRFQTGKYGKINKCITFPDMLDMIPFMTGTGDSPPLYMLYGVVVHLDTLNASFSGHYVSYVKDVQGTWFRIDDTEVEPVSLSRVMSEGAYILFYSRSYPRPPRVYTGRTTPLQAPPYSKHCTSKAKKSSSRLGQIKQHDVLVASEHSLVHAANMGSYSKEETNIDISHGAIDHSTRTSRNVLPTRPMYPESHIRDFSDATSSSDWSLFTSSDESSFTTESTRDSFSTVDYGDQHNSDPIFSIFNTFGVSCKKISPSEPQTRFFLESNGFVLDSSMSSQPLGSVHKRGPQQVTALTESLASSANNCSMSVRYGSNHKDSFVRTSGCCKL